MPWEKGKKIPTNLVVGFLGSGKTTAITKLIESRPDAEQWSILINEFGTVSIDHAFVDSDSQQISVEELGGGCFCCTMSFAFKPLMAQFIRRTKPDRLILEPSGISHPAKVVDILRSDGFAGVIDLKNVICLIDPKDFDDPRWQESEVFQDQVQLADIVVLNWSDVRDRKTIERCRRWVESFNPPKQLIVETSFGSMDPKLLDYEFTDVRFPLFAEAHPTPAENRELPTSTTEIGKTEVAGTEASKSNDVSVGQSAENLEAKSPLRFVDSSPELNACGWIFQIDDVFDRKKLRDYLANIPGVLRLKGVFRCGDDWWQVNRAKEAVDFSTSTYRRDSRLEIISDNNSVDWNAIEEGLVDCLL